MLTDAVMAAVIKWGWLYVAVPVIGWLALRDLRRLVSAVDRVPEAGWFAAVRDALAAVPPKEWFVRVEKKLDAIDLDRLTAHFANVHGLQSDMQASKNDRYVLRRDVDAIREDVDRLSERVRLVEVEQAKLTAVEG